LQPPYDVVANRLLARYTCEGGGCPSRWPSLWRLLLGRLLPWRLVLRRLVLRRRPGHEHQPELADLHLVTVAERRRLHPLPVDVGAVETADVPHRERAAVAVELRVPPRHRHVVQEDVAVGVPAAGGHVVV